MTIDKERKKPATPTTPEALEQSRALARNVAQLAHDSHCTNIVVLELAERSPVANHFVIATGTSAQQIRSVASEIEQLGKEQGFAVFGRAGRQQGHWVVIDFVDVVVHLFNEEYREYYDLELLWGDAPRLEWQRPAGKAE